MFRGDPTQPANPYAPQAYNRMPFQQDATNPYGFGYQRVAGQMQPQMQTQMPMNRNSAPQAAQWPSMQGMYQRPNYPNALPYGGRMPQPNDPWTLNPGAAVSNDPYGMNPQYTGGGMHIAPEPQVPMNEFFRRFGY